MSDRPFLIYKSSAGSGKTFTLAKEYLKLALRSPHYFRYILAVTFMNKAAEEMKSRILEYLKAISLGEHDLFDELKDYLKFSDEQLMERAGEVLRNILHNYSSFSITTIDTFFNQVIRSFTREIGLQGGYDIELDTDLVLQRVVDDLLEDVEQNEYLRDWLIDFAKNRLFEGKSYEFRAEIANLAKEIFKERYKSIEPQLSLVKSDKSILAKLHDRLNETISSFHTSMEKIGEEALSYLAQNNTDPADFSQKSKSVAFQFVKWKSGDLKEPTVTAVKATEDIAKWVPKSAPNKVFLEQLVNDYLMNQLTKGIEYYNEHHLSYNTAIEVRRYLYTFGILTDLTQKIKEYREEHETILISDLPVFLKSIIGDSDTPFIYEKVGTRYRHFLIDEFQDTSGFQWDSFQPLVKNSLDSGNFNMVVGDVKQSIYRWRGGNSDLLLSQVGEDVGEHFVNEQQLNSNYRSSKNVIDFNNALFSKAPETIENTLQEKVDTESSDLKFHLKGISKAFNEVHQEYPSKIKEGGYISVEFTKKDKDSDVSWDDMATQWAIKQVEKAQRAGVALKDIAILVKRNKEAAQLVQAFLDYKDSEKADKEMNYDVISSDAMHITSSVVVRFLLSVFRYLKNNKEQIALAEIVTIYHKDILQSEATIDELLGVNNLERHLPPDFTKHKNILVRFPLMELTEALIKIFQLNELKNEYSYLQAFEDSILEYVKNEKSDLHSFLEWWDEVGYKRTVQLSDDLEATKILTIHKSKGLQYKLVIMPFANWSMDNDMMHDNVLWPETDGLEVFSEVPVVPVKYTTKLENTNFSSIYFKEKIKAYVDNLNLLYVAFTRAEEGLVVYGELPSRARGIADVSELLLLELQNWKEWNAMTNQIELGDFSFRKGKSDDNSDQIQLEKYLSVKWRNKLTIKKQSSALLEEDNDERRSSINEGIVTHKILSNIKYEEDVSYAIEKAYHELEINKEELDRISQKISNLFNNEQIQDWFSKKWEVRTEAVVLPGKTDPKRLDRVLIDDKKAIVIDFKTGAKKSNDKKQVDEYMALLKEMGYEEVNGYLVYLEGVEIVHLIPGPSPQGEGS